jgi:hypothetical protein
MAMGGRHRPAALIGWTALAEAGSLIGQGYVSTPFAISVRTPVTKDLGVPAAMRRP